LPNVRHAPFFFEANIGASSICVNKVCSCEKKEVQPMPDVIHQLVAIREFQAIAF